MNIPGRRLPRELAVGFPPPAWGSTLHIPARLRLLAAAVLAAALVSGCGRKTAPTPLSPLARDAVVLSYIAGMNPMKELYQDRDTTSVLQDVLDRRVIHGGIQEELSGPARDRLPSVLHQVKPDLVILAYGLTDIRRQHDTGELRANLNAMILEARERGIDVALIAMPGAGFSMKPDPLYRELAEEHGIPVELDIAFELMRTHSLKGEKWTLNDAGVKRLAESIRDLLSTHGAL